VQAWLRRWCGRHGFGQPVRVDLVRLALGRGSAGCFERGRAVGDDVQHDLGCAGAVAGERVVAGEYEDEAGGLAVGSVVVGLDVARAVVERVEVVP
jgi:hypothetical protein